MAVCHSDDRCEIDTLRAPLDRCVYFSHAGGRLTAVSHDQVNQALVSLENKANNVATVFQKGFVFKCFEESVCFDILKPDIKTTSCAHISTSPFSYLSAMIYFYNWLSERNSIIASICSYYSQQILVDLSHTSHSGMFCDIEQQDWINRWNRAELWKVWEKYCVFSPLSICHIFLFGFKRKK